MSNGAWTKDHEKMTLEMNERGASAQEISVALSKTFGFYRSRNAVIGKIFRLLGSIKAGRKKASAPSRVIASDAAITEPSISIMPKKRSSERQVQWTRTLNDKAPAAGITALQAPTQGGRGQEKSHSILCRISAKGKQGPVDIYRFETDVASDNTCVSLMDLTRTQCHWPIGTPGTADFGYCGKPADGKGSYCAHHSAKAFVAPRANAKATPRRPLNRTPNYEGRFVNVQY